MAFAADLFAINGTYLYPPSGYQEENLPVVGYDLTGRPIHQGYPAFTFVWEFMKQDAMTDLMAAYDRTTPQVNVTFIEKDSGSLIERSGMMHEPIVGSRANIYYFNVAVRFSRIDDALP